MNKRYEFSDFYIENNRVYIKKHVKAAKPITGTKIGAITGDNPWSTPFVVFMDLYRFKVPFEPTIQVQKGIEYEPIVINGVNKKYNTSFIEYSSTPYYDWPLKGIGKKYNGKIDGWDKAKKIVLECKVTSDKNKFKWLKEKPPKYYLLQMLLYAKLAKADAVWLSGYFLNENDYEKPTPKVIDNSKLKTWKFKYDQKAQKILQEKLKIVEQFTKDNVKTRMSPQFDPSKKCDRELLDYLEIPYIKNL